MLKKLDQKSEVESFYDSISFKKFAVIAAGMTALGVLSTFPAQAANLTVAWSVFSAAGGTSLSGEYTVDGGAFAAAVSSSNPVTIPILSYSVINVPTGQVFSGLANPGSQVAFPSGGSGGFSWAASGAGLPSISNPFSITDAQGGSTGCLTGICSFGPYTATTFQGQVPNSFYSQQAIPEPLTMLGVGTAIGFGTFFKRKLAKKQNKK